MLQMKKISLSMGKCNCFFKPKSGVYHFRKRSVFFLKGCCNAPNLMKESVFYFFPFLHAEKKTVAVTNCLRNIVPEVAGVLIMWSRPKGLTHTFLHKKTSSNLLA